MKKYYVTDVREHEEWVDLMTDDKTEAIDYARDMWERMHPYDRKYSKIEIRTYLQDVEDENCDCWDYNTIEWQEMYVAIADGKKLIAGTYKECEEAIEAYSTEHEIEECSIVEQEAYGIETARMKALGLR